MGKHVIVGAGQVGRHLAELLATQGHDVTVVTRSGSGPENVTRIAADATDRDRLIEITKGADALYNVAAPPYTRWPQGVATARRRAASHRRGDRRGTGQRKQPLHLRPSRRPDD
jgi:nucleoside-diphosphate-sugar epimerase